MNIKTFFVTFLGIAGILAAFTVFASSKNDIVYPVVPLGGCANEQECRAYCDGLDHVSECLDFAELHNLLSRGDIEHARKFAHIETRPGGCLSQVECRAYCEDIANIEECLAFAEKHDVMDKRELGEARRVAQALASGVQLPGGCREKNECKAYCEDAVHINECLDFAIAAGFIPPEEADIARRVAPLMARGEMPGGCRSQKECRAYCSQEGRTEECVLVFERVGIVSAEEADLFRKTGGRGPGGCTGKEECETFCNASANQKICFEFAREHGLIPEHELANMEEGISRFREGIQSAPAEVARCLQSTIGAQVLDKIKAGEFLPNREVGDHMRRCFEEFAPQRPAEIEGVHEDGEGIPSDPDGQACMARMIANLTGPPPPDFEQRVRVECFGDFIER